MYSRWLYMYVCMVGVISCLQEENCAEHPVRHGEGDHQAHHKAQAPAGLRQGADVGHGVEDPRSGKDAEVKQSSWQLRSGQGVEEADHHEGNDVLQVVQVTPGHQQHTCGAKC